MTNPTMRVSIGLFTSEHRRKMGASIWVYGVILDWQTDQKGRVFSGSVVTQDKIGKRLGLSSRIIRRYLGRLQEQEYIQIRRTRSGQQIVVLNQKKFPFPTPLMTRHSDRNKVSGQDRNKVSGQIGTNCPVRSEQTVRSHYLSTLNKDPEEDLQHARVEEVESARAKLAAGSTLTLREVRLIEINRRR